MSPREQALAAGAKTYETGKPCKQGHVAPRATKTGTCTACTAAAAKAWAQRNPSRMREYSADYKARNAEAVREKDRLAKAEQRQRLPELVKQWRNDSYRRKAAEAGREVRPSNRLPEELLKQRLTAKHDGKLAYVSGFTGLLSPAVFTCTAHGGEIVAAPHNVLRGANPCTKCNHMKSGQEEALAEYLSIFTPVKPRDRTVIAPRELDIYMPQAKLAVEYCGMYWHSLKDAEAVRKDKNKHADKHEACARQGVRLLTIYESEWKERPNAVRRLLRNAVGKSRGKLMARKCELGKVPHAEAVAFYEKYHPQGGAGYGEHYGLFWNSKLVACMRFTLGANDRGNAKERVWTLTRYATRVTVAGGASRLFNAFVKEFRPAQVKSFSDNRFFDGKMYEQLGFTLEEEAAPDYAVWSPKLGLRPKSHYQRRHLAQRLRDHGLADSFDHETDPRSESELTFLMGCGRMYDCGKKKWVWTPQAT